MGIQNGFQRFSVVPRCYDNIICSIQSLSSCVHQFVDMGLWSQLIDIVCTDGYFLFICPAVILTFKFYDFHFASMGSGNTPCMHVCFCTGALEAYHFCTRNDFCQLLGQFTEIFCRGGELGTFFQLFSYCCVDGLWSIAQYHRTKPCYIVNIVVAINVVHVCTFAMGHADGILFIVSFMKRTADSINKVLFCFKK